MRQAVFNNYVNEFEIYLLNTTRFLHGVLQIKRENAVTLSHSAQNKHAFLGEIKEMSKTKILPSRNIIALELLQQRLVYISNRSLLDRDNANVWEYIYLRIDTDPFCTSCQISSIKKRLGPNIH